MPYQLEDGEIAMLDRNCGPNGPYARWVESVIVVDDGEATERSARLEVRVKGITDTFCARCFGVDLFEAGPDVCDIE
jgi:hypothetical protein